MVATWTPVAMGLAAVLSDEDPHDIGTTAAEGIATDASRHDHIHKLGADCVGGANIADDAVNAEHIGALTGLLDFNGQEAQNIVIHKAATPPTAALGKVYYDTDDNKLYVCTAI